MARQVRGVCGIARTESGLARMAGAGVGGHGNQGQKGPSGFFGRSSGRRAAKRLRKVVLLGGVDLRRQGGRVSLCCVGISARAVGFCRWQAVAPGDGVAGHLFHHVTAPDVGTQG